MPNVTFEKDIAPIFRQYRGSMLWRLDLTKYEDVKANANMIWSAIQQGGGMPPPPYPPLTPHQLRSFEEWMRGGFERE